MKLTHVMFICDSHVFINEYSVVPFLNVNTQASRNRLVNVSLLKRVEFVLNTRLLSTILCYVNLCYIGESNEISLFVSCGATRRPLKDILRFSERRTMEAFQFRGLEWRTSVGVTKPLKNMSSPTYTTVKPPQTSG